MKKCIKCEVIKDETKFGAHNVSSDGLDPYCKKCRNKISAKYRIKIKLLRNKKIPKNKIKNKIKQEISRYERYYKNPNKINKIKIKSRQISRSLFINGKIKKKNCFICNKKETGMHHIDYDYPKKVIWLCEKHHRKIHTNN